MTDDGGREQSMEKRGKKVHVCVFSTSRGMRYFDCFYRIKVWF